MKKTIAIALALLPFASLSKDKVVSGTVTYIAADAVYTSLGRNTGVANSTDLFVLSQRDTTATLRVYAVSSRSSVARVLNQKTDVKVGDRLVAFVVDGESREGLALQETPSTNSTSFQQGRKQIVPPVVDVGGRASVQYYAIRYATPAFNIDQPGVILNLRAEARDIPLSFDSYSSVRLLSTGGAGPFASSAINQTRIYRLSLSFDNGITAASVGRIIPSFLSSVGYVDGFLLSQQFGRVAIGGIAGYDPTFAREGFSTAYRKVAVFARFQQDGPINLTLSSGYARTYFEKDLDREVASIQASLFANGRFSLFAMGDIDLRKKVGDTYKLQPSLSNANINIRYRFVRMFSLGIGANAVRPVYPFSLVRSVPDSLLDSRARTGVSLTLDLTFPVGVSLHNTFMPRSSEGGFGQEYSENFSVTYANIVESGFTLRSNFDLNANRYTHSMGYGMSLSKNFSGVVDASVRYRQYQYDVRSISSQNKSTTIGADLFFFITRQLSLITTFERLQGYGVDSNSMFAEFSVRF